MTFFLIKDIKKGRTPVVTGEMIVPATVEFEQEAPASSSAPKPSKPKPKYYPKLPKTFDVKWILPPKGSAAYEQSKNFAESMGYDTVEHDDFSYPGVGK